MHAIEANKTDIINELTQMALMLNQYKICEDTSPIYAAISNCQETSTDEVWVYSIENLLFRITPTSHTIPYNADDITVALSVSVQGIFNHSINDIKNPLNALEFNVEISGAFLSKEEEVVNLKGAWHLDKHLPKQKGDLNKYIHPEYHLTYGGRKLWDLTGYDYGQSIILPTPRICHPPMDGILGIDFVIQNYVRKEYHAELTTSLDYLRLIKTSQARLWRPYYITIANSFPPLEGISIQTGISTISLVPNIAG